MGIEYFIGDKGILLTTSRWFNEFLNWAADVEAEEGEKFPNILTHSPVEGIYLLDERARAGLHTGSVQKLKAEVEMLLTLDPPDFAEHVLKQIIKACDLALLSNTPISLTYPQWDG